MHTWFDKLFFLFIALTLCAAQSGTNYWNAYYYNVSATCPEGCTCNIASATIFTDFIDNNLNGTNPLQIKATYNVQCTNPIPQFANFNVTMTGIISSSTSWNFAPANTNSFTVAPNFDASTSCVQSSGTSVVNLCPYWAFQHWMGGSPVAVCMSNRPRCDPWAVRWPFLQFVQASTSGIMYPMVRGNPRCPGASTNQGQGGSSQSYKQLTSLQLYGVKFTANATGTVKRVCYAAKTLNEVNFWLYTDNTNTPAGGSLLNGAEYIFYQTVSAAGNGILQDGNSYFCQENIYYPSLSVTNAASYWILGAYSGIGLVPFVSGGCAATSSFTSTAAIASTSQAPLVGPAGTVSNDCYFIWVETC
jgi:hypothetical protein